MAINTKPPQAAGTLFRFTVGRLALLVLVLAAAGCAGSYATIRTDDEITRMFQNRQTVEGYRYYHYSVPGYGTLAMLGLDPAYTLASRIWKAFDSAPDAFERHLERASRRSRGAEVADGQGRRMAVLYSSRPGLIVRVDDRNRVTVMIDDPSQKPSH